ncbi:BglG family transcription antiterminator [Carnobacterium gallinarum]|uniref:BglG family transcription antiterminator n=1 Tax=Carnobacterium gallinarum TaxID=2749 RepID=UPI00054CF3AB|nr:PTS sugar transporter subunit IIA [Carnobacterium gallinarum]
MKDRTLQILMRFMMANYPLALNELSEEFQVSCRTLRNNIKEINEFLAGQQLPTIKTIRNRGMFLTLDSYERCTLSNFFKEQNESVYLSREERIFDLILAFSLDEKPIFIYQKEAEYQISKSTMDEDMRRVRRTLWEYGIEVLSIPKEGIILRGVERTIRTMIYDIINKSIDVLNYLDLGDEGMTNFDKSLFRYIPKEALRRIDGFYTQSISPYEDLYRNHLVLFTAVWLSRFLRQDLIAHSSWDSIDTPQNEIRLFINALCEDFGFVPPVMELKYIVFTLETFNTRSMSNSIEWVQAQLLSIQLIQAVEEETKIPFSRKEESLHEGLYKHMVGLINRVKSDIQIFNPLKETIKLNYGTIYQAIEKFAPTIERISKKKLIEDEIAFLTIHFSISVSAINQEFKHVYKAVVVCNHGLATGKLLAENLKELFAIDVSAVLSSGEIDRITKLDVDVVFSTLNLKYQEKPVLVLDPIIKDSAQKNIQDFLMQHTQLKRLVNQTNDSTDFFHTVLTLIQENGGEVTGAMYQSLENLFDKNHLKINKKELQPMLKDVLKDSDILLLEECQNWEEAIQRVSIPLLQEKVITESYVKAMIASVQEFGPYIVIGKHLALAHARPEDGVNQLGISVATFREPIVFGHEENDPVKIIFCLAATDSYSHLNIMKSLIELIHDEAKVERLISCKDVEAFKEILYGI